MDLVNDDVKLYLRIASYEVYFFEIRYYTNAGAYTNYIPYMVNIFETLEDWEKIFKALNRVMAKMSNWRIYVYNSPMRAQNHFTPMGLKSFVRFTTCKKCTDEIKYWSLSDYSFRCTCPLSMVRKNSKPAPLIEGISRKDIYHYGGYYDIDKISM